MAALPKTDKGWLRQFLPNHTPEQLERFSERVGMMVDSHQIDGYKVENARREALRSLGFGR
jgi:hypothetical protein